VERIPHMRKRRSKLRKKSHKFQDNIMMKKNLKTRIRRGSHVYSAKASMEAPPIISSNMLTWTIKKTYKGYKA
jgi:hypothetical protein